MEIQRTTQMTISNGRIRRHCRKLQGCQITKHQTKRCTQSCQKKILLMAQKTLSDVRILPSTEKKNKKQSIGKKNNLLTKSSNICNRFRQFLKNANEKLDDKFVHSSYARIILPKPTTAKKPGQRKRVKAQRSSVKMYQ